MTAPNINYGQVSAVTDKFFVKKLADNVFDRSPLMKRAKSGFYEAVSGGDSIVMPLEYDDVPGGMYSGSETLDTSDNETFTASELQWKQAYANITISRLDELKNNSTNKMVDFVKSKMKNAEKTLVTILSTGLYSAGTNAKDVLGLRNWISASNTVGGISQSANSWYQAHIDSSTTTLSVAAMQTLYSDCQLDNNAPSVAMTTKAIYNRYYALLQPQQRFIDTETAKAGFTSLMFNGIPVIADSFAPTGYLFMLNEGTLHFFYHPEEDFRFEPFQKPTNQNVKIGKIYWAGNFGCDNNRLNGAMTAITA